MKTVRRALAIVVSLLVTAPMVHAQGHVIDKSALERAVQRQVARDEADRETIRALLTRRNVRDVAGKAGLSLRKAEGAVALLTSDDARQLAAHARQPGQDVVGGSAGKTVLTVVLTTVIVLVVLSYAIGFE